MSICNILKTLRKERGLTQSELAEKLKIGQATIACYENGRREPTVTNLIAYADFFECTLDFIVGRADDLGNVTVRASKTEHGTDMLTTSEMDLLKKYRTMKAVDRFKLEGYLEGICSK